VPVVPLAVRGNGEGAAEALADAASDDRLGDGAAPLETAGLPLEDAPRSPSARDRRSPPSWGRLNLKLRESQFSDLTLERGARV
jgi:hypothetical protein